MRDVLCRIMYGARISLFVAVGSVIMGLAIGGTIGAVAGAFGGRVDTVLMRITDVLLAIPGILLAIAIVVSLDRGLPQIMFAVAVTNAPIFARILRGSMLSLQGSDYVMAARSIGAPTSRVLFRHLLPELADRHSSWPPPSPSPRRSSTSPDSGSWGSDRPTRGSPEWGTMLTDASSFYRQAPWIIFFTGAAISVVAIGFNLLGDGLREALDPRMRR